MKSDNRHLHCRIGCRLPKDEWAQPWAVEDAARKRDEAKNRPDLTEEQRQTIEQAEDHNAVVKRIWLQCRPSSPGCVN